MRTDFSGNALITKCISFSLAVIKYVAVLESNKKYVVAKQLLRSATAIGACSMEAQSAESRADFIHKLKLADKEAYETLYWMILCRESEEYAFNEALLENLDEIMRLLNAILLSSKRTINQ